MHWMAQYMSWVAGLQGLQPPHAPVAHFSPSYDIPIQDTAMLISQDHAGQDRMEGGSMEGMRVGTMQAELVDLQQPQGLHQPSESNIDSYSSSGKTLLCA